MMNDQNSLDIFNNSSPTLMGLAYRILGSTCDAEDAVQDTYLKWQKADRGEIENPTAWLTTVCTRRCIDILRASHKSRVNYIGTWLPEPLQTTTGQSAEDKLELGSTLTTAFLLLLERLTPKERAAYLLHEVFDTSYTDIANTLEIKEASCRKLVSRARGHINQSKARFKTPIDKQKELLTAFQQALHNGDTANLSMLLSNDIELSADSGGKVIAIRGIIQGSNNILNFISEVLSPAWQEYKLITSEINNNLGLMLYHNGVLTGTVSFTYNIDCNVKDIYIMRNPDKLKTLRNPELEKHARKGMR
ncbi:RNA polymerase subunit sigma-24 [Paremcibacter congregatus]|uniref:RNA polymerase subunit sigma-24 n=2 Tax=Paremcibacter congregatus TaxID=2043170 RepID=A0A2G4YNI8_9PROT|nr:RNA polymerase subunit sigma-24 [Paremcibacter congregatus]QDE29236.1 sigma-70 family RNA polymerase sigma factor [Paremcibacter congregatus]